MRPPLLVLRPEPGVAATVAAAGAAGWEMVVAAPLFTVRALPFVPPAGPPPDALLFTSAQAPRLLGGRAAAWAHLPAYAVGAATAAAARDAGFAVVAAGAGDAAAIVARAAADGRARLLHLAGREHRAVAHPALRIERLACYAADAVTALPPAAAAVLAGPAVALLQSPRAGALWARLVDGAGVPRGRVGLAALSPAVAAAAGGGWAGVAVAAAPATPALLAAAARLCDNGQAEDGGWTIG